MGWLGWTEKQTLDTNIPSIILAWKGRQEMMLQGGGMFGARNSAPSDLPTKSMSPDKIMGAFRAAAGKKKRRRG